MKTKLLVVALFVSMVTMGFECINDPIIVSVNLNPVSGCWTVTTGNGSFNDSETIQVDLAIQENIDESYRDKILKLRIYDILVKVSGPHPNGVVTGDGFIGINSTTANQQLLHFTGPYADFAAGVSLFNTNYITPNNVGLQALINAFSDINNLPQIVTLRGAGSGPAVTQEFELCCEIKFQADANVK